MLEATREFRFGIDAPARSLTFKIERDKEEVYLFCREHPLMKHSWHSSGIHRYARSSTDPREAIERTTLTKLVKGYYVTVARVIFTTETDWAIHRKPVGKRYVALPQPDLSTVAMLSIGMTPHHPSKSSYTALDGNVATLRVNDEKYVTATLSMIPKDVFYSDIFAMHAPHRTTNFVNQLSTISSVRPVRDRIIHFRTKMNTLIYWIHHNMDDDDFESNHFLQIANRLNHAHQLSLSGVSIGVSPMNFGTLSPR